MQLPTIHGNSFRLWVGPTMGGRVHQWNATYSPQHLAVGTFILAGASWNGRGSTIINPSSACMLAACTKAGFGRPLGISFAGKSLDHQVQTCLAFQLNKPISAALQRIQETTQATDEMISSSILITP